MAVLTWIKGDRISYIESKGKNVNECNKKANKVKDVYLSCSHQRAKRHSANMAAVRPLT